MEQDLSPLPKIESVDRRIVKPEEYFRMPARYRFNRLLGHGAYGMVCAAMDYQLGHQVAIKRINQINSPLVAKRTLRELKLLRHFQGHPNIISVVDLFKSDTSSNFDELYITQELMDADLCHIIQSKYPISEEHIKRFLYQLLRGLKAMHSANVLHRDLKPGNILWKNNGELKICDFGLARGMAEPVDGCDISMTNYVATRWYRPPEILLYRAQYGKSLDMWSVGCIVAELFGRKVFLPGSSAMDQFHMIVQKLGTPSPEAIAAIPSLRSRQYVERLCKYPRIEFKERFPNISAPGLDLLERMLAFDPNQRITVTAALAHPYMAAYHDPAQEPTLPVFDFSFEARCHDLADIKSEIMAELALYHQPSPGLGCALKPAPADPRDPTLHRHRQLSAPGLAPNSHAEQPAPPKKPAGSFLAGLPPLIKRRFSMPARNLKPGPNSSA